MQHSEVTILSIRDLIPHPRNPRKISKESLNRLCDSIRDNGYWAHRPMAVEPVPERPGKYYILDGCQRKKAMGRLKRYDVPCMIYTDLTDDERDDIILRSNINNGDWEVETLQAEFADHVDFSYIGLEVELPELTAPGSGAGSSAESSAEIGTDAESSAETGAESSAETGADDESSAETGAEPAADPQKVSFYLRMLGDYLYPSNNEFEIPTLLTDNQPVHLELPFSPWGVESRHKVGITTYHFYVDDYRFEKLFKDPLLLLLSGCRAVVEPNCSIHDQTPIAYGIYQIYRKRYLARYLQECGMQIWADLNVSYRFEEYNRLGIPDGYNAFFTRGVTGWIEHLERNLAMARRISGCDTPNLCVYGGGRDIEDWCHNHDILYLAEFINQARKDR